MDKLTFIILCLALILGLTPHALRSVVYMGKDKKSLNGKPGTPNSKLFLWAKTAKIR